MGQRGVLPRTRWVYTTIPALLVLPPALFSVASLGGLQPPVRYERISFMNNDCLLDDVRTCSTRMHIYEGHVTSGSAS